MNTTTERLSIARNIRDLVAALPHMTMGEIIYAITRPHGDDSRTNKLSDLLTLTDEDILSRTEIVKQLEDE